eukprot:1161720-Pelagomonas_calceolata.AAC.5
MNVGCIPAISVQVRNQHKARTWRDVSRSIQRMLDSRFQKNTQKNTTEQCLTQTVLEGACPTYSTVFLSPAPPAGRGNPNQSGGSHGAHFGWHIV